MVARTQESAQMNPTAVPKPLGPVPRPKTRQKYEKWTGLYLSFVGGCSRELDIQQQVLGPVAIKTSCALVNHPPDLAMAMATGLARVMTMARVVAMATVAWPWLWLCPWLWQWPRPIAMDLAKAMVLAHADESLLGAGQ